MVYIIVRENWIRIHFERGIRIRTGSERNTLDPDPLHRVSSLLRRLGPDYLKQIVDQIQGADDKLGQFLDQDIEASASHRNVLRYFLKSCSSLVSPNVNKPLIFTKICRQNTKLVRQS